MKAKAQSFSFVTVTSSFEIPFFQRSYVWEEENWGALIDDFLETRHSQFFGSIILKNVTTETWEPQRALVIDGQQRLTTISILLKALNDCLGIGAAETHGIHSAAYPYLFYRPSNLRTDDQIRVLHSRVDRDAYEFVMRSPADAILNCDNGSRIVACYKYFYQRLADKDCSAEAKERLFNRLTNSNEPFLVVISLETNDQEQSIFDTINSAGVRLSYADTIKNALFYSALLKAKELHRESEVYKAYDESWFANFEGDASSRDFWQQEAQSIRVKRTTLEMFLHSFAVVRGFYDPRKDGLSDLPELYKSKLAGLNLDEILDFVKDLAAVAEVYREKLKDFGAQSEFIYDDGVARLFHILDQCNVLTFHPYLLHLFYKYKNDQKALEDRFKDLERFVMRQYASHASTRQNNSHCVEFIADEAAVSKRANEIRNEEIASRLRCIGNRQAKLILFWVELYRRRLDKNEVEKRRKYVYQLEHIMPQKWEKNWSSVPVLDDTGTVVSDGEAAKRVRNQKIYEIGNMTLLGKSLNVIISNSSLDVKIKGEGRKKGIRAYAELHITKDDILAPYDNGDVVWDEVHISKRTNALIGEFMTLWG